MEKIALTSIAITAAFHVGFFYVESIGFMKSRLPRLFNWSKEQATAVKPWAFNQGFYNLFLALGLLLSIFLINKGLAEEGEILATYTLLFVAGAGVVLFISEPILKVAALIQALSAIISLVLLKMAF